MSLLPKAIAGIVRAMRQRPELAEDLNPALLILAESLATCAVAPQVDAKLARLAALEHQLADLEPGERALAIRTRLKISKTTYYERRLSAIEQGLVARTG